MKSVNYIFAYFGTIALPKDKYFQIGKPFLPPLWALGYHFGSESFNNDQDIQAIVKSSIPLVCFVLQEINGGLFRFETFCVYLSEFSRILVITSI